MKTIGDTGIEVDSKAAAVETSKETTVQTSKEMDAETRKSIREAALKRDAEKPQNGIAGLKHWRHDMMAGLIVALVSVPLSLGIALASGAPPICGLTSEIIAGLIFPLLGGAYVTISGPNPLGL